MSNLVIMSKIGEKQINIDSAKISVEITKGGDFNHLLVTIKGPKGELKQSIEKGIEVKLEDGILTVERRSEEKEIKSLHGLYRSLLANMVEGVTNGYEKKLEIHGVGFRGVQKGKAIEFALGFSHPVLYEAPEDIEITMEGQEIVIVRGVNKQRVGQIAAEIRAIRKPEPYKGKGVRYQGEQVKRKAGKAGGS